MAYLVDHPPRRSQYRSPRRQDPTGCIVLHTAENATDLIMPDAGAEGVAGFIRSRLGPGSYQTVGDSDSRVKLVEYGDESYHCRTYRANQWALSYSFACRADQWAVLPDEWVAGAMAQGAAEVADMAEWLLLDHNITFTPQRITATEAVNGAVGFCTHAELDPGRRTDPGDGFPWFDFLTACESTIGARMPNYRHQLEGDYVQRLSQLYWFIGGREPSQTAHDYWLGRFRDDPTQFDKLLDDVEYALSNE